MTLSRVLLATSALFFALTLRGEIGVGDGRDQVLQTVGTPSARAVRGDREIFLYPHGGRIEFIDGKVVDVKGPLPTTVAPTTSSAASDTPPPTATPATPPHPKPAAAAAPVAKSSDGNLERLTEQMEQNPTAIPGSDAVGKELAKMSPSLGVGGGFPVSVPRFNWPKYVASIILHFGVTLLALWIAFKIEEMDALWTGTMAIAGIDAGFYALLEGLGRVTSGISSSTAIESGVGALVMVFTIRTFCINKRLQNAVVTAMCVKFVVQLCHIFLFVLLLNALFG